MAIRGTDFILDPVKTEKEYQLVEVTPWNDFDTKEHLGFNYVVLFPKLQFEKVRIQIPDKHSVVTPEELEGHGQVTVQFDTLHLGASHFNNRWAVKGTAKKVVRVGAK